ncbi:hypothetical protein [uncultured Cellulomonas sp.]|uniref:hypothetical protein n=1 Tax=uncultured Cellulomonas sp. TaxID=189682 RepID=UPI00260BFC8B|nr:hypothetical protein [uncultured Cellulomonas sp.]
MSMLDTLIGVSLGVVYAGLVNRRFGARSWVTWALVAPVVTVWALMALTSDVTEPARRMFQSFAIGALLLSALSTFLTERGPDERADAEDAVRAAEEDDVRRRNREATARLTDQLPAPQGRSTTPREPE